MAREDILGQTYLLPQNRFIQPGAQAQPVVPGQSNFNLPEAQVGGLAFVEGLTDKYYDLRGQIENYALSMQKDYNIDVTRPDPSQPGGGIPFKTFNKLSTELLVTANDLKNSMTRDTADEAGIRAGTFIRAQNYDPSQQLSSRSPIEERGFATDLLPEVTQANAILKTDVHTRADYNRFKTQVLDPVTQKLRDQMTTASPAEREYLQRNIDALVQQPQTTPYAAFQSAYGGGSRKPTIEIDILKDTTNLAQGRWGEGTFSRSTDSDGNPILINRKREGEQYGEFVYTDPKTKSQKRIPRVIDRWVKRGDGSIQLEFKKGDQGEEIPSEIVSDKRGDAVTSVLISSNPKYGSVTKMYEAAREYGITDDTGSVVNEYLLGETQSPDLSGDQAAIDSEKERIRQGVRALPIKFTGERPFVELRSKDGDQVMVKKGLTGKYYVEVVPKQQVDFAKTLKGYSKGSEKQLKGKEIKSGLTEDQLMEYLSKEVEGYYDQFMGQSEQPSQSTEKLPNETQAAYDLRMIRARRQQKQ
jgi:hypothetical protein